MDFQNHIANLSLKYTHMHAQNTICILIIHYRLAITYTQLNRIVESEKCHFKLSKFGNFNAFEVSNIAKSTRYTRNNTYVHNARICYACRQHSFCATFFLSTNLFSHTLHQHSARLSRFHPKG